MIGSRDKEKILEADLANIVRKVKSGKPLSKAERLLVEASQEQKTAAVPLPKAAPAIPALTGADWEKKVCVSMSQAAAVLNEHGFKIDKRLLRTLTKDAAFADAFRGNRVYLEKLLPPLRAKLSEPAEPGLARNKDVIEAEIAEEKLLAARRENARAAGDLMSVEEFVTWLTDKTQATRDILRGAGRKFLPRCQGLRTPEMLELWNNEFLPMVQKPLEDLGNQLRALKKS
jgi:hypothetical protein